MAPSFANAKLVSSLVLDSISNAIFRRGYAAQDAASVAAKSGVVMTRRQADDAMDSKVVPEKAAWGPDPKTGYYRPENSAEGIDVAELRAMLLKHKD